jgi:hypothetical protein
MPVVAEVDEGELAERDRPFERIGHREIGEFRENTCSLGLPDLSVQFPTQVNPP